MTVTSSAQSIRVRRSFRAHRHDHPRGLWSFRSSKPAHNTPAKNDRVASEENVGGDRLYLVLDQIQQQGPPSTIAGWKALVEGILVDERCAAERNRQISSYYAWAYMALPSSFKWAGMAAIASHHIRVALLPLHIENAFRGSFCYTLGPGRCQMLNDDVNTIRSTNNEIFDDLFWVHLAYVTSKDGIELLRALLQNDHHYGPILAGFEAIDQGRRVLEDATASSAARGRAQDLVWRGNLLLLEHEQRFVVQPNFDRLSDRYAWIVSMGAATTFDSRGPCHAIESFTSFYFYTLVHTNPSGTNGRVGPLVTNYDDRWRWLVSSVVPRFQRVDANSEVIQAILRPIQDQDHHHLASSCGTSIGSKQASTERTVSLRPEARRLGTVSNNEGSRTRGRKEEKQLI